jgi:hypothetical protein
VPFVRSAGRSIGRSVPISVDVGLGSMLGVQMGSQVVAGAQSGGIAGGTKEALKAGKELAVGGAGFKKGSVLVTDSKALIGAKELYSQISPIRATDLTPKVTTAKISELVGAGSNVEAVDLAYGKSFNIGNKPLVTHITGEGLTGFKKGAGAAPESLLSGKTTQSFAKAENPFFKATVKARGGSTEAKYLNSAMNIAEKVFNTRKPLYTPEKFEITSAAIPEAQRAPIVSAIKSYSGELKVAGSVPMKAQSTPFTTRSTHDLELYGDSVDNVIAHVSKSLKDAGFKEGKDFRRGVDVKGKVTNQVEFNLGGKTGENWDAGIEVFDHKTLQSDMPRAIAKDKSPIAFGYTDKPSVLVGNKAEGFIKTQDLSEQVVRKVAGSTFFKDNIMQPAHKNRVKDILDTTTTATAFAVKGKLGIGKDIITFVNSASEKFTPSEKDIALVESIKKKEYKPETAAEKKAADLAKMKVNFAEKVATDPVFKFIYENQRLPTLKEVPSLNDVAVSDKKLLYESKASAANEKTVKTGNPMIDGMINGVGRGLTRAQDMTALTNNRLSELFGEKGAFSKSLIKNESASMSLAKHEDIASLIRKQELTPVDSNTGELISTRRASPRVQKLSGEIKTRSQVQKFTPREKLINIEKSPAQRFTGIEKSAGFTRSEKSPWFSGSKTEASPSFSAGVRGSPNISTRYGINTNAGTSRLGDMLGMNTGWVSEQSSGNNNPSSHRTFDRSGMGAGSSLKQTAASPSWTSPSDIKPVPQISPSPKTNKIGQESPTPMSSKSSPSPIPSSSDSSVSPLPIPKDKSHGISPNPSPSPSPTPDFIPSFEKPTPIPIIPTSRKWRKTREIRNPNEIKKKRSDSQKGWHPGLLISSDKLVSRTKVAKFVESVKSVNAVKRKESVANMVKKAGTPMIKKSDEKVIVRLLM